MWWSHSCPHLRYLMLFIITFKNKLSSSLLLLLLLGVNHSADQVYNVLSKLGIMVRATTTVFPYVFENYLDM